MAKGTGLDSHLAVDGIDLTGDTASIDSLATPRGMYQKNGLADRAMVRVYGKRDGTAELTSYYNPAANQAHASWRTLPTTDRAAMVAFLGTINAPGYACNAKHIGYDGTRDADGDFLLKVGIQSNEFGMDPGRLHTAWPRSDTAATNGAGVDGVAASSFGLVAWLQVFSFTGTNCTVKLQQSSDNGGGDAFADVVGGGFTQFTTAPTTQRIATATDLAVERYLRVVTTGTFTAVSFVVLVARHEVAPV